MQLVTTSIHKYITKVFKKRGRDKREKERGKEKTLTK